MQQITDSVLIERLTKLVSVERKSTAEIVEALREVDERRLYLKLGYTSLFAYLTTGLLYSPASAQRRIEAARLLKKMPELKSDLASGDLNLTQVSLVAQGLRQQRTVLSNAHELLHEIKSKTIAESQVVIAQKLDLPVVEFETTRLQQDKSARLQLTLSDEDMKALQRVRELISHTHPNPSVADLIHYLADDF